MCIHTHTHTFIYSPVNEHLSFFYILAIVPNAALNISEQTSI